MRRCSQCILPETYPDLRFDEQGVCHKCHEHQAKYLGRDFARLESELRAIFDWAKRQNKRYDCVVPFSGGKDSSYTLYLCRKRYGLKALAVNFNNGLRTPEALINIENIVRKTDAAYVCYGPPWELMRKLYRAFLDQTGQFCFACDMGIWATVHRVAEQYDVPLIVSGFSAQIESRGAKIYSYDNHLFRSVTQGLISERELGDFLEETLWQKALRRLKHGRITRYRRQISLPDYIPWDIEDLMHVIHQELGWQPRADGSTDHIDCLFAPIKNYLVIQKWGFGEKTTKYSAMVRDGQISRDEALQRAQEEYQEIPGPLQAFKETFGLTDQDLRQARERSHLPYLGGSPGR